MGSNSESRNIGSRLEMFVDDWLIEMTDRATLRLNEPQFRGILMEWDRPWEGNSSGPFHSIIRHREVVRL